MEPLELIKYRRIKNSQRVERKQRSDSRSRPVMEQRSPPQRLATIISMVAFLRTQKAGFFVKTT